MKHDNFMGFRFTEREREFIERTAKARGASLSDVVRDAVRKMAEDLGEKVSDGSVSKATPVAR